MRSLIIIYELQQGISNNKKVLEDKIRKYGFYAFLTMNACIVFTDDTAVTVRDSLLQVLNPGDKLYVGETSAPAAWTNSLGKEVSEWILKNLKN